MFSPLTRRSGTWMESVQPSTAHVFLAVAEVFIDSSAVLSTLGFSGTLVISVQGSGIFAVSSFAERAEEALITVVGEGLFAQKRLTGNANVSLASSARLQNRPLVATAECSISTAGLLSVTPLESLVFVASVSGPVVYTPLNDEVYWTDGARVGQIKADGTVGVWGMSTPPEPQVVAVADGGLFAGTYQVAMTAVHPSGLESGASNTVSVVVAEGGGLQVTAPSATGVTFALYRTSAEGGKEALRQAMIVAPGSTNTLGVQALGKPLETLHAVRPLPGQALTTHKGRIWCASGSVVWFTDTKSPHWLFPATGYYSFESRVMMLASAEDGIYVATATRTYYLQGNDPYKMTQRPVAKTGAALGSAFEVPYDLFLGEKAFPSKQAAWWDTNGDLCIGKPGGIVVRPVRESFNAGEAQRGAMTYRTQEGLRQLVSVLQTEPGPLMAVDTAVAQVFANGVVLGG